jgi:hypothetical protein
MRLAFVRDRGHRLEAWVQHVGDMSAAVSGIGTVDHGGHPKLNKNPSGMATFNDRGAKPAP